MGRPQLGIETQRQWSDLAVARTTPLLFGLFSWVTLAAHSLGAGETTPARTAAWYDKPLPTSSDAVRQVAMWGDPKDREVNTKVVRGNG